MLKPENPFLTSSEQPPESRHERAERIRRETLIVCPRNDAESDMILRVAQKAGIIAVQSAQLHGAVLDREPDIVSRVGEGGRPRVWIIEMPGPAIEDELRAKGFDVTLIDHHRYKELDRATDPETHSPKPSSLEQFLDRACVEDTELLAWGFDPKTVRGLGIMDDRFISGLRAAEYSQEEIAKVLDASERYAKETTPMFEEIRKAATDAWSARTKIGKYVVVRSDYKKDIRGALVYATIRENMDTQPMIISSIGGLKIYVQNVEPGLVDHLLKTIPGKTFSFGGGMCWGVDGYGQSTHPTFDQVLEAVHAGISEGKR